MLIYGHPGDSMGGKEGTNLQLEASACKRKCRSKSNGIEMKRKKLTRQFVEKHVDLKGKLRLATGEIICQEKR